MSSGYKVRVSDDRGAMPDVQFYRTGNTATRTPQGLTSGAPDLAVEVISPTSVRHDRVTKLNWYARIGVPEYWIITPELRTLEQLILRDGLYVITQTATDNDVFKPETFPGLELPLGEFWTLPGDEPAQN